jgi:hypothetical protein
VISASQALSTLPPALRDPLLAEYESIVRNYSEGKWTAAELSGGKFCEIVYTILDGHAKGTYASSPSKPGNFVEACRRLESTTGVPRSFQILIPRLLPPLYEIRNNRNVGHVGGDVDANHMDATAVLSVANWIMAEIVRVFHSVSVQDAQRIVDALVERRTSMIWHTPRGKRVLRTDLALRDQILVLVASSPQPTKVTDLLAWTEVGNKGYFMQTLRFLHKDRLVELSEAEGTVELSPTGSEAASRLLVNHK